MPDKDATASDLAQRHYQVEGGMTQIFRVVGSAEAEVRPNEPIKLLEVNQNTIPAGIIPLHFAPSPAVGIHFPSIIIEVMPDEFEKIQTEELPLPHGWHVGERIERHLTDAGR